jgi:hypothetical protein
LYSDPDRNQGLKSLTVPYHDTNDFYFSGHLAWALIFANDIVGCNTKFGTFFAVYQFFNSFYLMTVLYVHYVVDYTSAIAVAWLAVRFAERVCYYPDVKLIGYATDERP